jgi:hypothetical protein
MANLRKNNQKCHCGLDPQYPANNEFNAGLLRRSCLTARNDEVSFYSHVFKSLHTHRHCERSEAIQNKK